jgi:hypothetical protein
MQSVMVGQETAFNIERPRLPYSTASPPSKSIFDVTQSFVVFTIALSAIAVQRLEVGHDTAVIQ